MKVKTIGILLFCMVLVALLAHKVINDVGTRMRQNAGRRACQCNLEVIGRGCLAYATQHEGRFPAFLADIATTNASNQQLSDPLLYTCLNRHPSGSLSNVDTWSDYIIVSGLSTSSPPDTILAFEPVSDHDGGNIGATCFM